MAQDSQTKREINVQKTHMHFWGTLPLVAIWIPMILLGRHTGASGGWGLCDQEALGDHLLQQSLWGLGPDTSRTLSAPFSPPPSHACAHAHPPHQASPPSVFPWVPNPACMTPEGYCLSPNNDFMGSRQQGKQEGFFLLLCKVLRLQKLWHLSISSLPEATSEVWTSQLYCIFLSCHLTPIPRHRFLSIFTGS